MSRIKNSFRNIKYNLIGQIISLFLSFATRTIFILYLNAEYLGLNGLFSNILSILSLAELGVGTAIVFSLYEPLANKNIIKLNAIMTLYKKTYYIIGAFIGIVGVLLTPFIDIFIKSLPDIKNINLIYILFVLNSSISYLFSYKRALIIADQKKYIDSIYQFTSLIVTYVLQILIIILTQNYLLYLIIRILTNLVENILISYRANKLYPFLKNKCKYKIENKDKLIIVKNIKAMFFHRVGTVIVMGTDNILISMFAGLISVGIYSNYVLITNMIQTFLGIIFQSITASIGNFGALESKIKLRQVFNRVDFIAYWAYAFSSIALFVLLNPFIEIWIGKEYTFHPIIVFFIVLNFYVQGMRKSILTFRDALGLFWYDRYKPIFESLINLLASIILALKYGVVGVLLGTFISTITTSLWIEPYVLYKHGFNEAPEYYFKRYAKRLFLTIVLGILTFYSSSLLTFEGIRSFIYKVLVSATIPNMVLILIYHNTEEFDFFNRMIKSYLFKKLRGDHNQ